jgi:hypothetical protein
VLGHRSQYHEQAIHTATARLVTPPVRQRGMNGFLSALPSPRGGASRATPECDVRRRNSSPMMSWHDQREIANY